MEKRKIINIDEEKCNGCGLCIPNCPEGAIQVIDGKARLVSDLFCDGLGACLGHCPQGAINIEERPAQAYSEEQVMVNIVRQGQGVIKAHLAHLEAHGQSEYLRQAKAYLKRNNIGISFDKNIHGAGAGHPGCPGARVMELKKSSAPIVARSNSQLNRGSELRQWPVQIMLVPANAPFLSNSDLLVASDCVAFAYADFHERLLKDKVLLVGCPKLDDTGLYREKFNQIFKQNSIKSVTYAHMEVPCCFGLIDVIKSAISLSGKDIPFKETVISISGERLK